MWQSTFHPDADRQAYDGMRQALFDQRRDFYLQTVHEAEKLARSAGLANGHEPLGPVLENHPGIGDLIFDDPAFNTWLRFMVRAVGLDDEREVLFHAGNLAEVGEGIETRLGGAAGSYVRGTRIAVQQEDLDPYIKSITPPSYDFLRRVKDAPEKAGDDATVGHPLPLQGELLSLAVEQIGRSWPEMHDQVLDLVKVIGYLPDASFRSCSAARYAGVVYIGNHDESILDIEESLVHETGHQALYRLAEVEPVTVPGVSQEKTFTLPWSGSKRDLFGFYHAFYIYLLLAKYFTRRALGDSAIAEEASLKAAFILAGLLKSIPMLKGQSGLSGQGHALFAALCADVEALRDEMLRLGLVR